MSNAFGFIFRRFRETFERFPLAVICVVAFNIIAEFDLVLPFDPPLPYDGRPLVFLLLCCGAFWSVNVKLCSESHGLSLGTSYAMSIITFLLVLFLSAVLQIIGVGALVYTLPVLFISMFIAPFIRRGITLKEICAFHNDFWSHIGRAIPVVILLYIIGGGVLYALHYFFDLPIGRREGGALTGIILFLYLPLTALAGIKKIQKKFITSRIHRARAMPITLSSIDHILVMEDIEGLIAAGAPVDEYQYEAARIAEAVNMLTEHNFRENNILEVVTLDWKKSFGLDDKEIALRLPALRRVAQAILDLRK